MREFVRITHGLLVEVSAGVLTHRYAIAECESGRIIEIRQRLGIDTNAFNPYRKRLIRKGIINGDERGFVKFTLPMFKEYVLENNYEM